MEYLGPDFDGIFKPAIVLVSAKEDYLHEAIGHLRLWGYMDIHATLSSIEALAVFEKLDKPAIFLIDRLLDRKDGLDGIRLTSHLRERNKLKRFSVACAVMFDRANHKLYADALRAGAKFFFVRKPEHSGLKYNLGELLRQYLVDTEEDLHGKQYFRTDPSTGLISQGDLDIRLEVTWKTLYRDQFGWMSAAMVDIDDFKFINDTHGHAMGDELIRAVAERLCLRPEDMVVRSYNKGDEYFLIFPRTSPEEASTVADRVRRSVEDTPIVLSNGVSLNIKISIGLASINLDMTTEMGIKTSKDVKRYLAEHTDKAMFAEKEPKKAFKKSRPTESA